MRRSLTFSARVRLGFVFLICLMVPGPVSRSQETDDPDSNAPTKESLIATLKQFLPLIEAGKWEAAVQYVVMPDGLEPRDLASIVRNNELSAGGIAVLQSNAKFGTAKERFGATRATALCEKMGIGTDNVFGFNHQQGDQWGEVLAQWDGERFRLVRVDDVGKLVAKTDAKTAKPDSGKMPPRRASPPKEDSEAASGLLNASRQEVLAAMPELLKAAESNPDDVAALARYAMALYRIGNHPEAWKQLMAAHKLEPRHAGVARGIDALMNSFTRTGIFTVSVPSETVAAILGEPNQRVDLGNERERWVYGFWGVDFRQGRVHEIIRLLGATEALFQPSESISVDLDGRGWRTQFRRKQKGRVTAFLLLPGETIANFTEQISVERYLGAAGLGSIKEIANKTVKDEIAAAPGTKLKVLRIDGESAYLAGEAPSEKSELQKTYRLIRLMRASKDLHRLQYSVESASPPSQETQRKWLKLFEAAELKPVTRGQ